MRTVTAALATAVLAATTASASKLVTRAPGGEQAVYWGLDNARSLGDYCASKEGIDILVLSFLDSYGNGQIPHGTMGDCTVGEDGNGENCDGLASDISTCQKAGKKIFLSIGGGGASGTLSSDDDAKKTADYLWNSYGNPSSVDSSYPRPLGDAHVDGWDLDIERSDGQEYYKTLMSQLRSDFEKDTSNKYYISGAPQCIWPDDNMGDEISNAVFDYLFIQFYNNPPCSAYQQVRPDDEAGSDGFNFDTWYSDVASTASKDAKLLIGLPASDQASGYDGEPGSKFFIKPGDELPKLINEFKSHPGFAGVMLWDAGNSDTATNGAGCTYAQSVRSVLDTGGDCSDSSNPSGGSSSAAPTVSASATTLVTSTKTSASVQSSATCSWEGHCAGTSCSVDTDCSDDLTCQAGKCA